MSPSPTTTPCRNPSRRRGPILLIGSAERPGEGRFLVADDEQVEDDEQRPRPGELISVLRCRHVDYQTSPARHSQLIASSRSMPALGPVRRTITFPSSSSVLTRPSAVRTKVAPSQVSQPNRP